MLKDRIVRLGIWNEEMDLKERQTIEKEIAKAVEESEGLPLIPVNYIFEDVFAEMPQNLKEQFEEAKVFLARESSSG
jgi:TPP-dependent pyruvate/acetoin dehydrogenase alpha subunit